MLKVKVFPAVDFLVAFIQTRGFLIVNDKPNILHYTGTNEKELRSLIKEDKPDLVVLNSKYIPLLDLDIIWVYQLARSSIEFYKTRKIYTNNFRLCQLYFQKLGKQAEICLIQKPVVKDEPRIRSVNGWLSRFFSIMEWK